MGDTLAGGGDTGSPGEDGCCAFTGLLVGGDLAVGVGVDTGEVLVLALARLECTVLGVVGGIECATDTIVDVLTELGSVGAVLVAGLDAELVGSHEAEKILVYA